jgi:hypothetical protein
MNSRKTKIGAWHVEGHRVVLERAAVALAHQVVQQPLCPGRVGVDVLQALLALGRDTGREQHVGVSGGRPDQLDPDVATERQFNSLVRHG